MKDLNGDDIYIKPVSSHPGTVSVYTVDDRDGTITAVWLNADNVEKFIKKIRKAIKESNNNG